MISQRHALQVERLRSFGQEHLLAFWQSLADAQRVSLLTQVEGLPLQLIADTFAKFKDHHRHGMPEAPSVVRPHGECAATSAKIGAQLIAEGKVCCFTVAGGQGTRLGHDGPKGLYPATPITGKNLFRVFGEAIAASQRRYGVRIPWYVMTSPLNHEATEQGFLRESWFGLRQEDVRLITQGTMPSLDADGKIVLSSRCEVALNPDGHGGSLRALAASGALAEMRDRGITTISYFQVDNPLVCVLDPVFLGLHAAHAESSGEMSSKAVPKSHAGERVGVFAKIIGRTQVLEYSDLPPELAEAVNEDGSLQFGAGNLAVHAIGVEFATRVAGDGTTFALPFHRAHKKVPFADPRSGETINPEQPNAWKLESFVFDALPLANKSLVMEVDRCEEFGPIKNATGSDSPASSHAAQVERAARWLEGAGVTVPRRADGTPDCTIEISSATALDANSLTEIPLPPSIAPGARLVL